MKVTCSSCEITAFPEQFQNQLVCITNSCPTVAGENGKKLFEELKKGSNPKVAGILIGKNEEFEKLLQKEKKHENK